MRLSNKIRNAGALFTVSKDTRLRLLAIMLVGVFWIGVLVPTASAIGAAELERRQTEAVQKAREQAKTHIKPLDEETNTKPDKFDYAGALPSKQSKNKPASDYAARTESPIPGVPGLGSQQVAAAAGQGLQAAPSAKPTFKEEEIVSKRTVDSTTTRNKDGSYTKKRYYAPQFYKKDGNWRDIDTTLIEDKNAGDSGNIFGRALGAAQSWLKEETTFTIKENDWQARFAPSDAAQGMVRVTYGDSHVGFSPVGANKVNPVITTESNGNQTVHYYNLWPGVDVEYAVLAAELKENIVLKNKESTADFAFKISGGSLKKTKAIADGMYGYSIKGALNDEFTIAPLAISLNKYGFEARQPLTHNVTGNQLHISVDRDYLHDLPADAYPVLVDPTYVKNIGFGTRAGGNYGSFKSDGYFCESTVCNPLAGSVLDSQGIWRTWRGIIYSDYHEVKGKQLDAATLHLTQRLGLSTSGTTAVKNFKAWHATDFCQNCLGVGSGTVAIGTSGDIDVKSIYQSRMNANDYNAWLMITGEETNSTTYKNWDPDNSYVQFTFTDVIPTPTVTSPVEGQVFIDPQVSFSSTKHTNPASGAALHYVFCVSTSTGCGGAVMVSSPQASAQWTIPDGMLQDGTTYYIQVQSYDPAVPVYSAWGVPKSFKIDSRTGKDATQAYDTLGPVSVDLATGNVTTSASSHSASALGGSMGISLDYNSPVRSRNGLVGKYWNLSSGASDALPTTAPAMTRVDQAIDFGWDSGSPATGVINNDWFFAQWTGYFVAPNTGTYYFGGKNDDLLRIFVDGQQLYANGGCYTGPCYGSTGITLQAGQVVPVEFHHKEATGPTYSHVWVKGAVTEGIIKNEWLQTGARTINDQYGLTGRYYKDNGTHDFNDSANTLIMQRTDQTVSFDWGAQAAAAGGPADNFLARWTGYITAPVTGNYEFATTADDGTRITIGTGNTQILNRWDSGSATTWSTAYALTGGQPTPVTIDYFEISGPARMFLKVRNTAVGIPEQIVPSSWLSYASRILPAGWNMGIDPDGNVSYDRIKITPNNAILTDSTGSTHEYKWDANKKAYLPPVNEDGQLTINKDATYTFQDTDGRTYVFNTDGTIQSITNPVDDARPAALQYTYGGTPSRLTQITDGVTSDRWAKVYYSGDTNCTVAPATFDTSAPANMLCAVKTNDGRTTSFFYKSGKLARIAEPGSELTDFGYDELGRVASVRDVLANDAIGASVRSDDATANTEITYDNIGRAASVTQPAATAGANRTQHTLGYFPGNGTYFGATEQHVVGATEPYGFSHRIEYDNLLRTIKDTDIASLSDTTEWDQYKDLVLSTTDETGLKSTTIYDDEDRPVTQYGPAPAAWYGTDRKPLTTYVSQVPRSDTAYDEGMQGPNVTYYGYSSASKSLTGAPKLHTTNLSGAAAGQFSKLYTSSPVPGTANDWGFRATGRMRLPTTGLYNFRIYSDGGVRLYIDDKLELDDWNDGAARSHPDISFNNVAGSVHKVRVEYYHRTGDANFQLYLTPPGGSETANVNQYISPDYSLTTSTKTYDSTLGDSTATTNYGSNPELGLAQSTSVDPTGLNLTTSSTYEQQGVTGSFLRQTSKNLPGSPGSNPSFTYSYYGATETRDDPCTTGVTEAYKQAGFMKLKTEADPDGTGSQTGRVTETVYDDAGKVVASRYNTDSWTCNTYDSRGRTTQTTVPAYNGEDARTIQNDYAVGGSPLVTTSWDADGWIVVWSDLLGRTTKYRDVFDDETTSIYDNFGKLVQRVSPMGTETYVYDNFNRLTEQRLDGVTYARVTYDQYSRIDAVDYPDAAGQKLAIGRDALGRQNSQTYYQGGSSVSGGNLVPNGSAEQPYPNTPSEPEGWHSSAWGTNTASFSYLNEGHTGGRSVKAELTNYTNGDAKWYFDALPVTGNTSYTFRDYYKSNVATEVVLQYTLQDTTHSYVSLGFPAASRRANSRHHHRIQPILLLSLKYLTKKNPRKSTSPSLLAVQVKATHSRQRTAARLSGIPATKLSH